MTATRAPGDRLSSAFSMPRADGLLFDLRFVYQHYRNVVANRVYPFALRAFQAAFVGLELQVGLAERAHQDFQKILAECHRFDLQVYQ
jgi:hypothetical protein